METHIRNLYDCILYTDGGCIVDKKIGAYSFILYDNKFNMIVTEYVSDKIYDTTNNIMELSAIVHGLYVALILGFVKILVASDSKYCVDNINMSIYKWIENNWVTSTGEPVKNKKIWEELYVLSTRAYIDFKWVKGHHIDQFNIKCDSMIKEVLKC